MTKKLDKNNKIRGSGYYLFDILKSDYKKYYSFVESRQLDAEENLEFLEFQKSYFKKNRQLPYKDEITKINLSQINTNNPLFSSAIKKEIEYFNSKQTLVKKLPNISETLIQKLNTDINKALNLNNTFNKYVKIEGTKYNELDVFPITGMYFVPSFLELVEQNKDYIKKYMTLLLDLAPNQDIYVSPHIYRVEKGQSGTFLHNDFNQHVIDNFDALKNIENGRKVLFYHLALTDITQDTCSLIVYPGTHQEFVTYPYALQYIIDNNYFHNAEEETNLLKAFYLAKKGLNGLPARLCILNKYYINKYKDNIEGITAYLQRGEGIFFNPFALHSSHITHQEDKPRITVAIRATTTPTKFFKQEYFDFLTHSLATIFNLDYEDFLNILYDGKEANKNQYLEILLTNDSNNSNITTSNMRKLFYKASEFFKTEEFIVSPDTLKKVQHYLKIYNT